jgi:hypothetical protein
VTNFSSAVVQSANHSFGFNGETSLDLEYGISLLLLAYFNIAQAAVAKKNSRL